MLGDRPNQIDKQREDVHVTADELLDVASTPGRDDRGRAAHQRQRRHPVPRVAGCGATAPSAIHNLMEDAATAEISRSQVWQWLHNDVELSNGETVTRELVTRLIDEEMDRTRQAPRRRRLRGRAVGRCRARCSSRWRSPTTSSTS